jgi:hypothetical protein
MQRAIIVSGFSESDRVREALKLGRGACGKKPYVMKKIGMALRNELDECKRLGVKRFVEKPLEYENFISVIKDIDKYDNPTGSAFER